MANTQIINQVAKIGDKIKCKGITMEIITIISQDYYEGNGWYIEFVDKSGRYRYWKQCYDGGILISKE